MWLNNLTIQIVDAHNQMKEYISAKWKEEKYPTKYLKPDSIFWSKMETKH
ncbi:hypothetical protein [Olleya sp. Bg11-27]|nr:hypothetical protein [Olleya sp. Bg11-27]